MKKRMLLMTNELMSAGFVGLMVSVLVWLHLPRDTSDPDVDPKKKTVSVIIKSFVVSFGVSYAIFYFLGDSGSDDVLENVIQGEPDF